MFTRLALAVVVCAWAVTARNPSRFEGYVRSRDTNASFIVTSLREHLGSGGSLSCVTTCYNGVTREWGRTVRRRLGVV